MQLTGASSTLPLVSIVLAVPLALTGNETVRADAPPHFDCGYRSPGEVAAALRAAVEAGKITDPSKRVLPHVRQRTPRRSNGDPVRAAGSDVPTVTASDIFLFEDTDEILPTNFSGEALDALLAEASNALIASHGDDFDFVGFFLNFAPGNQFGSAFYLGLENDVAGIGIPAFNNRASFGIAGDNIEGLVMMWRQSSWTSGSSELAAFTQLVLGQEFEHRFGVFVDSLPGGRRLQGENGPCGRGAHWNFRADGQGSGMEMREWTGSSPAFLGGDCAVFPVTCFNRDVGRLSSEIAGVFSYPDLYLMGYVSPEEMDSGASQLRYMDDSSACSSPYGGAISTWSSADLISVNGPRNPSSNSEQQHYRTGWVMLHLPGVPPTSGQLDNVVNILNQWGETYAWSTLGRGTMNNTLLPACSTDEDCDDADPCNGTETCDANVGVCVLAFTDCNENGIDDVCDLSECDGSPACSDCNANGAPDRCDLFGPFAATSPELSPVVGGQALNYELAFPPEPVGDVTFSFATTADLGDSTKRIDVQVNNRLIGSVFGSDGQTCPEVPDTAELVLSLEDFNAIPSFGLYAIALIPFGNVNSDLCPSFITVTVQFETQTGLDCNENSILDECEPDCQPNGIPDECELADGTVADCQSNGVPDACDIASGTSADANGTGIPDECEPCIDNAECNENGVCEFGRCLDGVCQITPALYGDVASAGGICGPDGGIDLADILAVLDGFSGTFRDGCELVNVDIAGVGGNCTPDEDINLSDILNVLDAFQGLDRCCASGR